MSSTAPYVPFIKLAKDTKSAALKRLPEVLNKTESAFVNANAARFSLCVRSLPVMREDASDMCVRVSPRIMKSIVTVECKK